MNIKRQLVFSAIAGSTILMLTGCGYLLGPAKSSQPEPVAPKKEQAALPTEPVTLQPEAAPSAEKKKPPRTIQALKPPSDEATPSTGKALPKPAKTRKTRCKVRNDAVAWVHVSGGCKDGYAHGNGRAHSVDGKRTYAGEFAQGYFSGQGNYDWGDGTTYSGEFKKSKKNGQGTLTYPDKSNYRGEFRNNRYDGEGTYVSAHGDTYAGRFQSGHYQGRGTFTWASGNTYAGEFRDDRMEGEGTFTLRKGEQYAGRFKNNEMNGEGVYTWPNGDRYKGGFKDDTMNGEGEYAYAAEGMRYAGRFKDGKKDGEGTLFTADGAVKQQWRNGEKIADLSLE